MPRLRILLPLLVALVVANVAWLVWSRWGLITIHADDRPLPEVIRSIEKQGGIRLHSNLDPATKVKMHVTRVPLTEALETLSALTEARWRLAYVFGQDQGAIATAIAGFEAGQKTEGWKLIYVPLFGTPGAEVEEIPPDPRRDTWTVKAPAEPTLQAYLEEAGRNVSAAFAVPETWNPTIGKAPGSGEITKLAPKLASAAGGKYEEFFLLERGARRGPPDTAETGDGARPPGPPGGGGMNREAIEQRALAEIAKLPAEKQPAAKQEFEERKAFFASMADLTPDQRRAKMEDFFSRPEVQERMEERLAQDESRRTPEQRVERFKKYNERKAAIKAGQAPNPAANPAPAAR